MKIKRTSTSVFFGTYGNKYLPFDAYSLISKLDKFVNDNSSIFEEYGSEKVFRRGLVKNADKFSNYVIPGTVIDLENAYVTFLRLLNVVDDDFVEKYKALKSKGKRFATVVLGSILTRRFIQDPFTGEKVYEDKNKCAKYYFNALNNLCYVTLELISELLDMQPLYFFVDEVFLMGNLNKIELDLFKDIKLKIIFAAFYQYYVFKLDPLKTYIQKKDFFHLTLANDINKESNTYKICRQLVMDNLI